MSEPLEAAAVTVRDVMVGEPIVMPPAASILEVVREMNRHRIGAILIGLGTTLHGIFTERDLLRMAADAAPGWRQLPVGDWMTRDPYSVSPDAEWEDAMALMERLRVRHLPVVDDGTLVGIVSSRQLMGRRTSHLDRLVEDRTRELQITTTALLERDRQIQQQLRVAGNLLNRALLPQGPFDAPDLAWAVHYAPLDPLGGDYYDFVAPDGDHLGVLIADASGHSVPAAMVAVMARIAFAEVVRTTTRPAEVLRAMNERLVGLTDERFVTAFFTLYDRRARTLTCANAGHPHPLRYDARRDRCDAFGPRGLMLGVMPDMRYEESTLTLGTGDRLCFLTDGVTETSDTHGEMFGIRRLEAALAGAATLDAGALLNRLRSIHNTFRADHPVGDDVTMLVGEVR